MDGTIQGFAVDARGSFRYSNGEPSVFIHSAPDWGDFAIRRMTQAQALAILKSGVNVFLTGEPGSGKTYTVNRYIAYLRTHGIEPAVTASTGIAATHLHGMTIHSWSGIGVKSVLSDSDLAHIADNDRVVKRIRRTSVLVIDEISMLSAATLDAVDAVCRKVRRLSLPFGGLQVILVGDFFQLPPVAREGTTVQFAFAAPAWQRLTLSVCYLAEQHRQEDPAFLGVLTAIRRNACAPSHFAALNTRLGQHAGVAVTVTRLLPHNVDVDAVNQRQLATIAGDSKVFMMHAAGPRPMVESLQRGCLSPQRLELKVGAVVMFTKNNPSSGVVNGTLGTVMDFDDDTSFPIVELRSGRSVEAAPLEWAVEEGGKKRATITQVPLRLAWAITVHKSQGMSMDAAVIDLAAAFAFGQGYVALSRVRRLSGIHLLGYNQRALAVHPDVLVQDRVFREQSAAALADWSGHSPEHTQQQEARFIVASGGKLTPSTPTSNETPFGSLRARHPQAYRRWTPPDEAQLRQLFAEGASPSSIAATLGRQPGGIRSRLRKLGLIQD